MEIKRFCLFLSLWALSKLCLSGAGFPATTVLCIACASSLEGTEVSKPAMVGGSEEGLVPGAVPAPDSLQLDLQDVEIVERFSIAEIRAATPQQKLDRAALQTLNAQNLSDAVKHFAGVTVKDYGGVGGMKTVSIRSLGAQHTAVSYDGVALSDTQSGQIDIGRFSLDNVDVVGLAVGQTNDIFCTARQMAAAGLLDIQTLAPRFEAGRRHRAKLSLGAGSFGLLNPSFRWEQKLSERYAYSLNGEYTHSHGRYPYTLSYGTASDSIAHKRRSNGRVSKARMEAELFGHPGDKQEWRTKIYYYQSYQELPNAVTFYNDFQKANLRDRQAFVQSKYSYDINEIWAIKAALKYQNSYQLYTDEGSLATALGSSQSESRQDEYYASYSTLCRLRPQWSIAHNTDVSINTMQANLPEFAKPTRYSLLTAIAGKYQNKRLTANASLLGTFIKEEVKNGKAGKDFRQLSPYTSISLKPFEDELYVRAFFKHGFRLPSFNDLYYGSVGNTDLKPEKAWQYNAGLTWAKSIATWFPKIHLSLDAYYNRIEDKIVAIPTKNLFVWSMMNLGRVDIHGLDASINSSFRLATNYHMNLSANYTFQQALDHTSKEGASGKVYGHQIAYTPRHSGSGQMSLNTPYGQISYAMIACGDRFVLGQNIAANRLKGYSDHSISYFKDFQWQGYQADIKLEVLNLLNENYAVIKYFPMPGRSFRASLKLYL